MILRLLCVSLPSLAALIMANLRNSPRHLKVYFVAQLVNAVIVLGYGHVSDMGWRLLYMVGTACIFGAMAEILWESGLRSMTLFVTSLVLTGAIVLMVAVNMAAFTAGNDIVLGEGAILTFAAFALGFRSMHLEHKAIYVTLVILWMALAFFDFAYALNTPIADSLQYWLPAALIGAAMVVIGWRLGQEVPAS